MVTIGGSTPPMSSSDVVRRVNDDDAVSGMDSLSYVSSKTRGMVVEFVSISN